MRAVNDDDTSRRLPSAAWLLAMAVSAAILIYGTFVILNLAGLR